MYVPTSLPNIHNWMGYRQPHTARIKFICCGPSKNNYCPVGARTVAPCAHGAFILYSGCFLANNPQAFKSTHKSVNIVDPGLGLPSQYDADLMAGSRG